MRIAFGGAFGLVMGFAGFGGEALAQRAQENAARMAGDAFGVYVGNEQVGLYSSSDARGFSPTAAGNVRLNGFYADAPAGFSARLTASSQVRVGITAISYPFPSPTGIIDYTIRPAGEKALVSVLASGGPFGSYNLEVDAQQPIVSGKLSLAYGVYYQHYEPLPRDDDRASYGFVVAPRWSPREGIEVRPFWGITKRVNDKGGILVFPGGAVLPKPIRPRNFSPDWLGSDNLFNQIGVISTALITSRWTLRTGAFWYKNESDGVISDNYTGVNADGLATTRRFTNLRPFDYTSASGEARLTGVFAGRALRHQVHLTARARDVERTYGGAAQASFANLMIGQDNAPAELNWIYGRDFDDRIRQHSAGVAYQLAYRDLGEVTAGILRTDYRRILTSPDGAKSVVRTKPWLANGAAAINLHPKVALYAAFTRGLEEAPVAPEVAVNAAEPPAAIRTRQHEVGTRVALRRNLRLVLGYFDIQKPYFNLDGGRVWRELGVERHSGFEGSLTGDLAKGLTIVAGYVHQEPRVAGEAVRLGIIGDNPVGQPRNTARVSLDYRPFGTPAFSVDGAAVLYGARPVSTRGLAELGGRQLTVPSNLTFDLGLRRRFAMRGRPMTVRLLAQNVAGKGGWTATTAGGLAPITPRRLILSLTADL